MGSEVYASLPEHGLICVLSVVRRTRCLLFIVIGTELTFVAGGCDRGGMTGLAEEVDEGLSPFLGCPLYPNGLFLVVSEKQGPVLSIVIMDC